uniref:Uncharacterized protein n=1 Tax=Anaerobacillus isosaccharinicus TaxID=1532552 RepID=A0A1S2LBR8_9BACI
MTRVFLMEKGKFPVVTILSLTTMHGHKPISVHKNEKKSTLYRLFLVFVFLRCLTPFVDIFNNFSTYRGQNPKITLTLKTEKSSTRSGLFLGFVF